MDEIGKQHNLSQAVPQLYNEFETEGLANPSPTPRGHIPRSLHCIDLPTLQGAIWRLAAALVQKKNL